LFSRKALNNAATAVLLHFQHFHPEEAMRSGAHAVGHSNNTIGSGEGCAHRCPFVGVEVIRVFELIRLTGDGRVFNIKGLKHNVLETH
jgi:hypothetical protein